MSKKKKAAAAAVTVAAVAGMVTGAAFETPAEMFDDAPIAAMEQEEETASRPAQLRKKGLAAVRQWIMGLPEAVRMLVAVPLWCFGWVLEMGLSTFWLRADAPILQRILGWLCLGGILLCVFAASVKSAFPKCPLRKIFRPRNVLLPLLAALILGAADLALPSLWKGYDPATRLVWRVGSALLLAFLCFAELKWQGKRYAAREEPASGRSFVEEEAWRLADTVCPRR